MIFLHPFLKFVMMWCCKHSVCLHLHSFGLEDDFKSLMDNFMMPLLQKEWASWLHIMLPWSLLVLCVCVWVVLQRGTGVQFPSSFKYSPNQSHANCSLLVAVHMSPLSKYIWTTNTLKGNANMSFFLYIMNETLPVLRRWVTNTFTLSISTIYPPPHPLIFLWLGSVQPWGWRISLLSEVLKAG